MKFSVDSEVGELESVILHRPGTIITYDRTVNTNRYLTSQGIEVLTISPAPSSATVAVTRMA